MLLILFFKLKKLCRVKSKPVRKLNKKISKLIKDIQTKINVYLFFICSLINNNILYNAKIYSIWSSTHKKPHTELPKPHSEPNNKVNTTKPI